MFSSKNKYPKYYAYHGRKISKKISLSKKNLINEYFNKYSFDEQIIQCLLKGDPNKKIDISKKYIKTNIEIGFGNGDFLIQNALSNPRELFIGVEVYLNGIAKVLTKILSLKIENIILSNLNCFYFLYVIPNNSVDKIFIINPDPWTKKRHKKRRIMSYEMLKLLGNIVKSKHSIYMTTDSELYLKDTINILKEHEVTFGEYRCNRLSKNDIFYGISRYQLKAIKKKEKIYMLTF